MRFRSLALAAVALAAATLPASAIAQTSAGQSQAAAMAAATAAQQAMVRANLTGASASQTLSLPRGKSAIVELPVDARDVLVTNPKVADAVLRTPRRIYVLGVNAGQTDAVFFDAAGRRILSLDIRVDQDTGAVAQTINRALPGANVRVDAMNDSLILSGQVSGAADVDKAVQIARAAVASPDKVINMIGIADKDQVMLKVRIVEMQRNVIKQLGFNTSAVLNQVGEPQFLFGVSPTFGVNGSQLGGLVGGYDLNTTNQPVVANANPDLGCVPGDGGNTVINRLAQAACVATGRAGDAGLNQGRGLLQAFERVGLVRTLAEPNLTAVSGESAKFLAGGEYPVPVSQDDRGRISITFKPFGVGLGFTPVVLSGGRISLRISTEVSELTTQGAFSMAAANNTSPTLVIPALDVRRAETTVELPSGGSMMIAGLLQEKSKQTLDSLPGLMNMPVLGALFRSRDYLAGETELVVIVTPYIVSPTHSGRMQTPVDGLRTASDASTILLGQLNRTYKAKPQAEAGRSYQGPYGYVIE